MDHVLDVSHLPINCASEWGVHGFPCTERLPHGRRWMFRIIKPVHTHCCHVPPLTLRALPTAAGSTSIRAASPLQTSSLPLSPIQRRWVSRAGPSVRPTESATSGTPRIRHKSGPSPPRSAPPKRPDSHTRRISHRRTGSRNSDCGIKHHQ